MHLHPDVTKCIVKTLEKKTKLLDLPSTVQEIGLTHQPVRWWLVWGGYDAEGALLNG